MLVDQTRFEQRWDLLHHLDDPLRSGPANGSAMADYDQFYADAKGLMYNPVVTKAFTFTAADAAAYGSTGFGNACLMAKQALAANQGTRYIEIMLGGWDMHQNMFSRAYQPNMYSMCNDLDTGVSNLALDLKSSGDFPKTLILMMGEFGRTPGEQNARGGRDHFKDVMSAAMLGGALRSAGDAKTPMVLGVVMTALNIANTTIGSSNANAVEAANEYGEEPDADETDEDAREEAALDWLRKRTQVIEFDGGVVVQKF